PVLVELFTSEGCSSCPPADELLARIERAQPVPGAQIIALGEHVDYWNRLGWTDRYSSAQFTERQSEYAQVFKTDAIYTPQMVIDGRAEFVGSDLNKARKAIATATRAPKGTVQITRSPGSAGTKPGALGLQIRPEGVPSLSDGDIGQVLLAVVEDNLYSEVRGGENAGRKLNHSAVARQLQVIGKLTSRGPNPFLAQVALTLANSWKRENLRLIVFIQERDSRRIIAAGVAKLTAL
ncbi:MAG TPA: DUF1223 domain-containing protein, partial [Acidobacteriota bacterium]